MKKNGSEPSPESQLSPEEIDALRAKLSPNEGHQFNVREYGAITIEDLAEGSGLSTEQVRHHLDQIRAEKAFGVAQKKKRSQMGMLILATTLLVLAGTIYKLTPRKMSDDEIESWIKTNQTRIKSKPKKITYPIRTTIDLGENGLPIGLDLQLNGRYTVTQAKSSPDAPHLTVDEATQVLAKALVTMLAKTEELDRTAPRPEKPLPVDQNASHGFKYFQGQIGYSISGRGFGTTGYLPITSNTPHARLEDRQKVIANTASRIIKQNWDIQLNTLQTDSRASKMGIIYPPCGVRLTVKGRSNYVSQASSLSLKPVDEAAFARRLNMSIRGYLALDKGDDDRFGFGGGQTKSKTPMPPYIVFDVEGPLDNWQFKVPTATCRDYGSAYEAIQASEKVIKLNVEKATSQMNLINTGKVK